MAGGRTTKRTDGFIILEDSKPSRQRKSTLRPEINVCLSNRAWGSSWFVILVGLIDHAGHASLRSLDGSLRAEPLHACMGSGSGEPRLWTRSERSRHFRLHPSRRPRGTIRPGSDCGAVGQVMPPPPIRAGTQCRRPTCGAGRQQACGPPRRWRAGAPWFSSAACPRPSSWTTRSSA